MSRWTLNVTYDGDRRPSWRGVVILSLVALIVFAVVVWLIAVAVVLARQ